MDKKVKKFPDFTYLDLVGDDVSYKKDYFISNILLQVYLYIFHELYHPTTYQEYLKGVSDYIQNYFVVEKVTPEIRIQKSNFMQAKDATQIFNSLRNSTKDVVTQSDQFLLPSSEAIKYVEFFLRQTYNYNPNDLIVDFYLTEDEYVTEGNYRHRVFFNENEFDEWVNYRKSLMRRYRYQKDLMEPHDIFIDGKKYTAQNVNEDFQLAVYLVYRYQQDNINVYGGGQKSPWFNPELYQKFNANDIDVSIYDIKRDTWSQKGKDGTILKSDSSYAALL